MENWNFAVLKKGFSLLVGFAQVKKAGLFRNQNTTYLNKPFYCSQTPPISATDTANSHPAITCCPPKNDAVLFIFALTPYAVTPERRTDSKPFRRRFVRKTGFGLCRRKLLRNYFRQSFESRSQDGVPRAFWLLFARRKK